MKRFFAFCLVICTSVYLSACAVEGEYPTLTPTTDITAPEETTVPKNEDALISINAPFLSVAVPVITETETAADGNVIFKNIYQNMSLILPDQSVADRIILDFLNRIDSGSEHADAIRAAAKENYSQSDWTPYLCQVAYDPMRIDPAVLSMFGHYASYNGTPHPEAEYLSVTYDLLTGSPLSLPNLFPNRADIDTLIDLIIAALDAQKDDKALFTDYADTVEIRIKGNYHHESAWYFDTEGLCFYFSPYEIAPYASGMISAHIPYEQLAGLMNDAYFPGETETVSGQLTVKTFDPSEAENYNEFSELVIDENGTAVLLSADTAIYDIRIETGTWSADGNTFTSAHTLFAANVLTKDTALVLKAAATSSLPNLRISYKTGDKIVHQFLSYNNESIHLTTGV